MKNNEKILYKCYTVIGGSIEDIYVAKILTERERKETKENEFNELIKLHQLPLSASNPAFNRSSLFLCSSEIVGNSRLYFSNV